MTAYLSVNKITKLPKKTKGSQCGMKNHIQLMKCAGENKVVIVSKKSNNNSEGQQILRICCALINQSETYKPN